MVQRRLLDPPELGIEVPPTEDELPYDDGMPLESQRHVLQMVFLIEQLTLLFQDRDDVFVGGNMFVYFSPDQVLTHDFRGPDFFVALGVPKRERKSWVTWWEGKAPDVVIELLSESTARVDKGEKMEVYRDQLRIPEYFWYHPFTGDLAGFTLHNGDYEPIATDDAGRLASRQLGLTLVQWEGTYQDVPARWLRWATADGVVLPILAEVAEEEHRVAEQERQRAEQERQRAEHQRRLAEQERQRADQERQRAEDERQVTEQERQRAEQLARRVAELEALLDRGADGSGSTAE